MIITACGFLVPNMEVAVEKKTKAESCLYCRHFRNDPEFLESVYKGLTSLSSAYGAVRCQDGICQKNDLYLAANRWCASFEPYPV